MPKGLSNLLRQVFILHLALTGFPLTPGVVAAFRHTQHMTQGFHGILLLLLLNELVPPPYVLENTIKAFFTISRSCRVTSSSRLRRRITSCLRGPMTTSWKGFVSTSGQFLIAPESSAWYGLRSRLQVRDQPRL